MKEIKTHETVAQNVRSLMTRQRLNVSELATIMNVSRGTVYNRFLNPDEFQVGELDKLAAYGRKHGEPKLTTESFFKAR